MNSRLFHVPACLLLLILLGAISTGWQTVIAATPTTVSSSSVLQSVIPEYRQEFGEQLGDMPRYQMDLVLDEATSILGGTATVSFLNRTGMALDQLPFRLYPNAPYYDEGETTIEYLAVDAVAIEPRFDESATVLFVDLPEVVAPDEWVTVEMEFSTVVPRSASGSFGILNHDLDAQRFVLADWYPIVAGWDETGWRLEPPTEQGDPTFAATSVYDIRLIVPDGYEIVAPGITTMLDDGSIVIATGPLREFAMVVGTDVETQTASVDETTVRIHADPLQDEAARHVLDIAVAALGFYNQMLGDYPFRELDIVTADLSLAYGVSWSGIIFINESLLASAPDDRAALDFTVFHEIGHQWWGGTVGMNSNDHTFMSEGLTNATALLAQAEVQGTEIAVPSLYAWMVIPYANLLNGMGDAVVDISIFDQSTTAPISTLAYGKGGLGFLAIRDRIGNAAFWTALADYAEIYRLGIAEPHDLLDAFEAASGQSVQAWWDFWFESAATTPTDVDELVANIIESF